MICPMERGRIGEGEEIREHNTDSESRRRGRSPRNKSSSSRPKGSTDAAPVVEQDKTTTEDEESEIVIPEIKQVPNTPSVDE